MKVAVVPQPIRTSARIALATCAVVVLAIGTAYLLGETSRSESVRAIAFAHLLVGLVWLLAVVRPWSGLAILSCVAAGIFMRLALATASIETPLVVLGPVVVIAASDGRPGWVHLVSAVTGFALAWPIGLPGGPSQGTAGSV